MPIETASAIAGTTGPHGMTNLAGCVPCESDQLEVPLMQGSHCWNEDSASVRFS